jgi:WXG100 family type VII secretion target
MGQLVVNFAALEAASQHISTAISTMNAKLDDLDRDGRALSATWDGGAQQSYAVRQATWTAAAADLTQILTDIQKSLNESAAEYAATEKSNANLFS